MSDKQDDIQRSFHFEDPDQMDLFEGGESDSFQGAFSPSRLEMVVLGLLQEWKMKSEDQAALLGVSVDQLDEIKETGLPEREEVHERVGALVRISMAFRRLYPEPHEWYARLLLGSGKAKTMSVSNLLAVADKLEEQAREMC